MPRLPWEAGKADTQSSVITTCPMQTPGMDIFQHPGQAYSFIVDYYLGYPWVQTIKNQEADQVIQLLTAVCNQFGYPVSIISDRGFQN